MRRLLTLLLTRSNRGDHQWWWLHASDKDNTERAFLYTKEVLSDVVRRALIKEEQNAAPTTECSNTPSPPSE